MRKLCEVQNCGRPRVSHGLCDMHRLRLREHGHLHTTRPEDWGKREKHPLYHTWGEIKKKIKHGKADPVWKDFWKFIADVGNRPENHRLIPKERFLPIGPNNWQWSPKTPDTTRAAYSKSWRNNRDPAALKNLYLRSKYGITILDYARKLEEQGGVCAICKEPESNEYALAVDHCHKTQKIRELLCCSCNTALGHMKDSPALLRKAAEYLERHAESDVQVIDPAPIERLLT